MSQATISGDLGLSENAVMTAKTDKAKRSIVRYEINQGTKPEVAAAKIIEKFGDQFAGELKPRGCWAEGLFSRAGGCCTKLV